MTLREKFDNELVGIDEMTQELWDWFVDNGYELTCMHLGYKNVEVIRPNGKKVGYNGELPTVPVKEFLASVKPRIKIVCENLEEGQVFKFEKGSHKYKIIGDNIYVNMGDEAWNKSIITFNDIANNKITLVNEPTEIEKLEKELKVIHEKIEKIKQNNCK